MRTLIEDITEVEKDIKAIREKARLAWHRTMRETEDGSHRAETTARYARHDLGKETE